MNFKSTFVLFGLLVFVGGCGTNQAPNEIAREPEYQPNLSTPGFFIDSHVHYVPTDEWENSFIEVYTKWNAMACIMIDLGDLDRGLQFAEAYPDRVIPYIQLDMDSPTVLEDIQNSVDSGCRGIGELITHLDKNYDDPSYDPIWELAEKLGIPVLPHTGIRGPGFLSRLRPGYLGTISYKFPDLMIHAAHFGNPWYNEAGEVARRNKNIYFDLTGSSLLKKDNDPGFWKQFLWWTPYLGKSHMPADARPAFEKLVFGSDENPEYLEENIMRFNKMLDACGVSEASRKVIYYETMANILNIDVSKYLILKP